MEIFPYRPLVVSTNLVSNLVSSALYLYKVLVKVIQTYAVLPVIKYAVHYLNYYYEVVY